MNWLTSYQHVLTSAHFLKLCCCFRVSEFLGSSSNKNQSAQHLQLTPLALLALPRDLRDLPVDIREDLRWEAVHSLHSLRNIATCNMTQWPLAPTPNISNSLPSSIQNPTWSTSTHFNPLQSTLSSLLFSSASMLAHWLARSIFKAFPKPLMVRCTSRTDQTLEVLAS